METSPVALTDEQMFGTSAPEPTADVGLTDEQMFGTSAPITQPISDGLTDEQMFGNTSPTVGLTDEQMFGAKGPQIGVGESLGRGALQGASMGTSDEAIGMTQAIYEKSRGSRIPFKQLYEKYRDESRAANAAAEKANPGTYKTGEIGSGIATAFIPGGIAAKGLSGVVKAGAAYGGAAGLGYSEAKDIKGMAKDTALGAAGGVVVGSLFHGVVQGISRLAKVPTEAARKEAYIVAKRAEELIDQQVDHFAAASAGYDDDFNHFILSHKDYKANVTETNIADKAITTADNTTTKVEQREAKAAGKYIKDVAKAENKAQGVLQKSAEKLDARVEANIKQQTDLEDKISYFQKAAIDALDSIYNKAKVPLSKNKAKVRLSKLTDKHVAAVEGANKAKSDLENIVSSNVHKTHALDLQLTEQITKAIQNAEKVAGSAPQKSDLSTIFGAALTNRLKSLDTARQQRIIYKVKQKLAANIDAHATPGIDKFDNSLSATNKFRSVLDESAPDIFKRQFDQFSPEKKLEIYTEFKRRNAYLQAIRENKAKYLDDLGSNDRDPMGFIRRWFVAPSDNARRFDAQSGSNFSGVHGMMRQAEDVVPVHVNPILRKLSEVKALAIKEMEAANAAAFSAGKPPRYESLSHYHNSLSKQIERKSYKPGSVAEQLSVLIKEAKDKANSLGMNIQEYKPVGEIEGYLPHVKLSPAKLQLKMDDALARFRNNTMSEKEQQLFWQTLQQLGDKAGVKIDENTDLNSIRRFIDVELSPNAGKPAKRSTAEGSAAFSRQLEINPYVRERDPFKLIADYTNENVKAALFQVPIMAMKTQIEGARILGAVKIAEYYEKLLSHWLGSTSNFKAAANERTARWRLIGQRDMRESDTPIGKLMGALKYASPDLGPWLIGNMYHSLLAVNPFSYVRNLAQPIAQGAMDLQSQLGTAGMPYVSGLTARAYRKTFFTKGSIFGKTGPAQTGLSSQHGVEGLATNHLAEGLREAAVPGVFGSVVRGTAKAAEVYDKFAQGLMKAVDSADKINRAVTREMAFGVIDDVVRGNKHALKLLEGVPPGIKAQIDTALGKKNINAAKDLLSQYYNVRHELSYTKADMNALGREYGTLATAFTKFPIAIGADIMHGVQMKEKFPLIYKYMLPLLMAQGADNLTKEQREDMGPLSKLFFRDTFTAFAPISGALVVPPPVLTVPYEVSAEAKKFVMDDMPNLETDEIPAAFLKHAGNQLEKAGLFLPALGLGTQSYKTFKKAGLLGED